MKLKFDANLQYQLDAIQSVTDLFEGQSASPLGAQTVLGSQAGSLPMELNELGIGNPSLLPDAALLKNLQSIQEGNLLAKSPDLNEYAAESKKDAYSFPNFSVEMETGTGKTYVYLRTLFELNQKYGFKKFIIVVPSVAIREGVLSSISLMREHFRSLYNNTPFDHFVYSSKDLSKVRQFATSNEIQILIINIQAFQKDDNVINQERDKMSGRRPIEFVQAARPIIIIDEPQSVDTTPKSTRAIKTLKPLFCLRYSATHTNPYNLLYKLDPIRAYDMRLVKQIEVASIRAEENFNQVYLRIDKITYAKKAKTPHVKATLHEDGKSGPKVKIVTLKQGTDLSQQTNRPGYDSYIVTNICAEPGLEHVEFANGKVLELHQEEGGTGDDVLKAQIRQTIEEHFKKERKFKALGIKVLSLFFVNKVDNYRLYDEEGNPQQGKFALWFEEYFQEISQKPLYKGLLPYPVEELHDGYFSVDKKHKVKDTGGNTIADAETYELIMKDKERLLSNDEPLRFIFSHSALKEGWDNPNVFQICSLRDMGTERERRQILGRGLRLPVNQDGTRIFDETINNAGAVIANESFEDYAKGLQADMEEVLGDFKFGCLQPIAFTLLLNPETDKPLGKGASKKVWKALIENGYLTTEGDLTEKFSPEEKGFVLELPEALVSLRAAITDEMKRYVFKNRIVNASDRRVLKYNKRIELNPDFKALWEKISHQTRYSIEFQTDTLIERAAEKIAKMDRIQPIRLQVDKTAVEINKAGVEGGRVLESGVQSIQRHTQLPDILAFLQRETELTRHTLVSILKQSDRLEEFTINPQSFMTEAAKHINRALQEMLVDGIKYERLAGQHYAMRLFEQEEIETYLTRLYAVQSKDERTPYDYVLFESEVERDIAEKLDTSESVKFFCKLPQWFKIPTPLGNYNPDWAIVKEDDNKLYLVRETKSTHDRDKRRDTENRKIDCGHAHFSALGVDFKTAIDIYEVLSA
ncbi:MAG: type III restriction endonuclease [Phormidesmis priestleyi]|uniref:Type III restriction endonuclease n=1 Tax=Phormidesmis priestleyi TaxID=268141 RepID=A0A2W4XP16_9CYAN|nr:MAG: type III restriction endonuclease [Phormidesmis priestleyi]